jgi:hypothetical protein
LNTDYTIKLGHHEKATTDSVHIVRRSGICP